jgi:hypothetical protein
MLLMRKLDINGAGLIWFGSCYKYFGERAAQDLPNIFLQPVIIWYIYVRVYCRTGWR